jgi:hypothetical protein
MVSKFTLEEFYRQAINYISRHQPSVGPSIVGSLVGPEVRMGLYFVGAFRRGIPEGSPQAGTVMLSAGPFRLPRPTETRSSLLAAFLPLVDDNFGVLCSLPVDGEIDLGVVPLRPVTQLDPPLVVALPVLLGATALHPRLE